MTCWENTGKWHTNNTKDIGTIYCKWFVPMRILGLSIEEYVKLLINQFNAKGLYYYKPTDYLGFYFLTEKEAKKFCSYVNKIAKQKSFICKT